ncbi:MAG: hypothetical protein ACXVBE_10700, partial [Bdellovibrionota bacterium]
MAKMKDFTPRENKGKMTFVMFQLEGADATLQKGFDAMEQAFEKLGGGTRTALAIRDSGISLLGSPEATVKASAINSEPEDFSPASDESPADDTESEYQQESRAAKQRRYTVPSVVNVDMNAELSFKDYFAKVGSPAEDSKRYLAIAIWFNEYRSTPEISADHVYTVFRHMGWTPQKDVAQPLRNLKKRSCFEKG